METCWLRHKIDALGVREIGEGLIEDKLKERLRV